MTSAINSADAAVLYVKTRVQKQPQVIKVGQTVPDIQLSRYVDAKTRKLFSTLSELSGDLVVLFSVPKAFTPVCSQQHLSGYVKAAAEFKKLGATVACLAVNTPDEMQAWAALHDPQGEILMIPDYLGQFVEALGIGMDKTGERGLGYVAKRCAMVFKKGKLDFIDCDENAAECKLSSAATLLEVLKKQQASTAKTENKKA